MILNENECRDVIDFESYHLVQTANHQLNAENEVFETVWGKI